MIHLSALAIAMVVGLLRGGRLLGIGEIRLRRSWLIIAAFGLQLAIVYVPGLQGGGRFGLTAMVIIFSYLLLLGGIIANRHVTGIKLLGIGMLLNFVVMLANGGFMPISPEAAGEMGLLPSNGEIVLETRVPRSKDILLAPEQTHLWFLSDIFVSSRYVPLKTVFSIGDVVGAIGLFIAIQHAMLSGRRVAAERSAKATA